jgi:hypothetical protein
LLITIGSSRALASATEESSGPWLVARPLREESEYELGVEQVDDPGAEETREPTSAIGQAGVRDRSGNPRIAVVENLGLGPSQHQAAL